MSWRKTILVLMLALTEAALIAPIVMLLLPLPLRSLPGGALALVWLILSGLAMQWQALAHFNFSLRGQRILMGGWLVALVVAAELGSFASTPSLAPDLLSMLPGFIVALVVWWRGMALGTSDLHPRVADLHLQIGLLLLIASAATTLFSRSTDMLIYIAAFFFGALSAVALSNLELTHGSVIGRRVPMSRSWWGWILAAPVGVLLAGLLLTSVLTGRSVVSLLGLLISLLLLPVVLLVALIPESFFDWLGEIIRRIAAMLGSLAPLSDGLVPPQSPDAQPNIPGLPPAVNFGIALAIFAALVSLVILLMRRANRQAIPLLVQTADAEGALNKAFAEQTSGGDSRFSLSQLRRWLAALTIRRLYARAAYEASRRGYKRLPAQTPYDFLPLLQRAFPTAEREASTITQAYVAAHYGEVPDTKEALDALKTSWDRMRATSPTPHSRLPTT